MAAPKPPVQGTTQPQSPVQGTTQLSPELQRYQDAIVAMAQRDQGTAPKPPEPPPWTPPGFDSRYENINPFGGLPPAPPLDRTALENYYKAYGFRAKIGGDDEDVAQRIRAHAKRIQAERATRTRRPYATPERQAAEDALLKQADMLFPPAQGPPKPPRNTDLLS